MRHWEQIIKFIIQLGEEINTNFRVRVKNAPGPGGGVTFLSQLTNIIKTIMLFRSAFTGVLAKHMVMSKLGQYTIGFLKDHRVFSVLILLLITFLVEILAVQKLTFNELWLLLLISLVNLYICERKFKENNEDLRYYFLMFLFLNALWVIIFFCDEFLVIIGWFL